MFGNDERGGPTGLRGWLSDVYFSALVEGALGPLTLRLGSKATVDDPQFGRAAGLPALEGQLKSVVEWLKSHGATYERGQFTTGADRDSTEGIVALDVGGKRVELPVAVVAERRRNREVELRVYYATRPLGGTSKKRGPLVPSGGASVPELAESHLDALKNGDVDAALACFEGDAVLRQADGTAHGKAQGSLAAYFKKIAAGGWDARRGGSADDGRTTVLEYTVHKIAGKDVEPQAGLFVYERGDSGLFRALRLYDDIDAM